MSCPSPDRFLDYLAHRLAEDERATVDAHVDGCAPCRELLVELARGGADEIVAPHPVEQPAAIGRYRVVARLGDGGMATVYAAYDPQLERRVAVKLVHPELATRTAVERLLREGRALARLSHANVVAVHDAGTDGGRVYLAMELVEGETLAAWLRGAPRGWRAIARMFAAAGRGVTAAHRAGIVHRDFKPENVLIDRAGTPKVADFGLAGHSDPVTAAPPPGEPTAPPIRLTRPGMVMGTPLFMSPEQRAGRDVGPATDQYSLCAALAGATSGGSVPRWLRAAIVRGMAAEPADRYRSMDQLVAAIDPDRRAARTRRVALAVAAAAALTAGAGYAVTRGHDEVAAACERAAAERARLWTADDRAGVERALLTTGVSYAPETWPRVDAAVASQLAALAGAEARLCEQRPNSAASRAAFDQAAACFDERRRELADLVAALRRAGAADVRTAVTRVHRLSSLDDCTSPAALAAERAARATPLGLANRRAVASELTLARAAFDAGQFRDAADHVHRAVALARTFGGAILARTLLATGELASAVDGFPAVAAAMREAAAEAETAQADALRALALANLMAAMAREPGHENEALAFRPLVEAAIARAGKQAALLPMVQQAAGAAQARLGQGDAAIASFSAALDAARAALPPRDPRLPEYIYPVGVALSMVRREAEAVRYHAEAYRVATEIWGPDHPSAVRYEINLAVEHGALGDCATALREAGHARAVLTGVLPAHSPEHLLITETMGSCDYAQHDYDAALREHTARQAALEAAGLGRSVDMAGTWIDIGDVELDRKHAAAAAADYQRALALLEEVVGTSDARLGLPLTRYGEALLAGGHREHAAQPLARAVALYTAAHTAPLVAADALYPLARALWPGDRTRARRLATSARDAYRTGGAAFAARASEVDAWLRNHR